MGREHNIWTTTVIGLAAGMMCTAAPALTALALAGAVGFLHVRDSAPARAHLASLVTLGAIVIAGLIGGPPWTIGAALIWRVTTECRAHSGASPLHFAVAPAAALALRLDAPDALVLAAACVALVAWIDWIVARLAAWRLETPHEDGRVILAQAALLAPLLLLPAPGAVLAALVATAVARTVPTTRPVYAAA